MLYLLIEEPRHLFSLSQSSPLILEPSFYKNKVIDSLLMNPKSNCNFLRMNSHLLIQEHFFVFGKLSDIIETIIQSKIRWHHNHLFTCVVWWTVPIKISSLWGLDQTHLQPYFNGPQQLSPWPWALHRSQCHNVTQHWWW